MKHLNNVDNIENINDALIEEINAALRECDDMTAFYGGQYLYIGETTKTLSYPTTEVLSSLEEHIRNNPHDHGVSIH